MKKYFITFFGILIGGPLVILGTGVFLSIFALPVIIDASVFHQYFSRNYHLMFGLSFLVWVAAIGSFFLNILEV